MCGICGTLETGPRPSGALEGLADAMAKALAHRGPDDHGTWVDAEAGLALGQRRLAILDLSPAGRQPMASASGRFVMVLNGEVYNYADLRSALEADAKGPLPWRGHSDTEVLLEGIERWGLEATLRRAVGMFALAVWDRQERVLRLARDRVGEKPLYYGWQDGRFLFASELKGLRAHPRFRAEVDRDSLALYFRFGYVPGPHCIYRGLRKLPPGTILEVRADAPGARPEPVPYWSAREVAEAGRARPFRGTEAEAVDRLEALLRDAVRHCMVSDVPLGVFLSGGLDSSTVAALMQAQSPRPIRTFTIGFREAAFDEAQHARAVAEHLGTQHEELYVTPEEARAVIPRLPAIYDEPFADSSMIPTFLVSQLARRHVTVALSGDAGDELFGGYERYLKAAAAWRRLSWMPRPLRRAAAAVLRSASPRAWDLLLKPLAPVLRKRLRAGSAGQAVHKLAAALDARGFGDFYLRLVSLWQEPTELVRGAREPPVNATDPALLAFEGSPEERMMLLDLVSYLPDDILVKVDRASMAVALEARVPLLDHRVVAFAWSLPLALRVRAGEGKRLLRQVLYRHVPRDLVDRPKQGFGVPVGEWLRGPLRGWAEDLLAEDRLRAEGFLEPGPVRQRWREHLDGTRDGAPQLWAVLMFQAWLEAQRAEAPLAPVPSVPR